MTRDRGFALLLVLWTMVLLALLVTHIASNGRAEAQLAGNIRAAAITRAAADGAIATAAYELLLPPADRWRPGGALRTLDLDGVRTTIRIADEGGRVNPNGASPPLLAALLAQLGADAGTAARIAGAIADWRSPGETPGPNGAKLPEYVAAGLRYGPADRPFQRLSELGAVLGMTPGLLHRLLPYLSLYTTTDPDPALAAPPVLAALHTVYGNTLPPPPSPTAIPPVVTITATATGPNGARFTRRATLRLEIDQGGTRPPQVLVAGWSK